MRRKLWDGVEVPPLKDAQHPVLVIETWDTRREKTMPIPMPPREKEASHTRKQERGFGVGKNLTEESSHLIHQGHEAPQKNKAFPGLVPKEARGQRTERSRKEEGGARASHPRNGRKRGPDGSG